MSNQDTSIWSDIKATLRAIFKTVVTTATTCEKVVQLAECEVDNLREMQEIRLDLTKAERQVQLKALTDAQLAPV